MQRFHSKRQHHQRMQCQRNPLQYNSKTKGSQKWVANDLDDESLGDSSEEPSPRPQKKCCEKQKKICEEEEDKEEDKEKEEEEEVVPVNEAQPQIDSEV
jgi:hypothetical protein